jgi:hypothetical protein
MELTRKKESNVENVMVVSSDCGKQNDGEDKKKIFIIIILLLK